MWRTVEILTKLGRDTFPAHAQRRIARRFLEQLQHRTPEEIRKRLSRRWFAYRYAVQTLDNPIAVVMQMLAAPDCPDPRCEDGELLGLEDNKRCPRCDERAGEHTRNSDDGPAAGSARVLDVPQPRRDDAPSPPPVRQVLAQMFPDDHASADTTGRGLAAARAALPSGSTTRHGAHPRRNHHGDDPT